MHPRGFISSGLAIAGLAVISPLLIGVASCMYMCMYILDGAPILFRQERLGLHRAPFIIWKLRTM
jgi:lipopolysaccharide/colanic/teichoic acid biosynthesis glycosyltransferase